MVRLIRCNSNGFFCYTFCNTNDGIRKGSQRVSNEIKSILRSNPSIHKLSIIGCSLGGMYGRYCLTQLFDTDNLTNTTINGRKIELINYISLATPHCGTVDRFSDAPCCCSCCAVILHIPQDAMKKYCCYPATLQELLLFDQDNLLKKMATDELFLVPLRLFKQRLIFGNGKNDARVSCASALMLYRSGEQNIGEDCWDRMIKNNEKVLIHELSVRGNENDIDANSDVDDRKELDENCWFIKLRNDIEWKRIVVCFDFDDPHTLMNTPPFGEPEKSRLFLAELQKNFMY